MHSSQYDNACDQLEDERQELIYLYEESHPSSDDEYDSYYDRKLDGYDSF
jgi:hypothetical protein